MQSNKGIQYSVILHLVLFVLIVFGLPEFLTPEPDPQPVAISVDILPIAPISNVKPQEKTPEKPEPKKPAEEQKTEKKATPETKKEEVKKPEPEPLPTPEKKPEIKKPEIKKPEEKKPVKKKEDNLESIFKSVKDTAKATESKQPTEKTAPPNQKEAKSDRYDDTIPLSLSEIDGIKQQFEPCWNVPSGAKDAHNLIITVNVKLNEDGSVVSAELHGDRARYLSDSFFRTAADSAIRAVKRCSPLKQLPTGKYGTWRELELVFDPSKML